MRSWAHCPLIITDYTRPRAFTRVQPMCPALQSLLYYWPESILDDPLILITLIKLEALTDNYIETASNRSLAGSRSLVTWVYIGAGDPSTCTKTQRIGLYRGYNSHLNPPL